MINFMQSFSEMTIIEQAKQDGITHISTGNAILRGNKILMVRRAKDDFLGGYFELPGGGVDEGEAIEEAAYREVKEETGLMPTKTLATFEGFDYSTDKKPRVRQVNFLIEVKPGKVVLSDEHDAYLWVDSSSLLDIKTTDSMRTCVKNAFVAAGSK
jgi:8-oxo-dGTP diphosphatase